MKMVKSLLLGSAAGLVAVAGAQAADLPVKAKAVEYVKVCSLYGAGFYYIPGTDTCIKIGGFVRAEATYNAGGSFATYLNGANARFDNGTNRMPFRTRVALSADVRTQTEYGTLRSYLRGGWQWSTADSISANNNVTYYDRGFIQFAGFTFGKTESFFDFYPVPLYSYQTQFFEGSSGGSGQTVFAYTAQFGNGVSASISAEDQSYRSAAVSPVGAFTVGTTAATASPFSSGAVVNGTPNNNRGGQNIPDFVGNIRVDQAWGSAQIQGALHNNTAIGYSNATSPNGAITGPGDKWGWAAGAGLTLKMPWAATDTLSLQGTYCEGAVRYCANANVNSANSQSAGTATSGFGVILRRGGEVSIGYANDAYFGTNGNLELSKAWSLAGGFQHYWTPALRSSVYTQYLNYEANSTTFNAACVTAGLQSGCGDWNGYQIGTRTAWTPVANLEIGVDLMYTKVDTAFKGGTVNQVVNNGTVSTPIGDNDVWSAIFRVQRNFWP